MSRYLLDTTALIDFSKEREPAFSFILSAARAGEQLGICAINVAEFYAGLPLRARGKWERFVGSLQYWEITKPAAVRAGEYRYEFARSGQILSTMDALVAAVARENQATIVTSNVKDYPMADIQLLPLT
jgi:predicted nucleic acid-binding protein